MNDQIITEGKCWKLFWATLNSNWCTLVELNDFHLQALFDDMVFLIIFFLHLLNQQAVEKTQYVMTQRFFVQLV